VVVSISRTGATGKPGRLFISFSRSNAVDCYLVLPYRRRRIKYSAVYPFIVGASNIHLSIGEEHETYWENRPCTGGMYAGSLTRRGSGKGSLETGNDLV
jgi:hypothetical protein